MNSIILHGDLRERYGAEFRLDVSSPVEAYRALECQLPEFRHMIRSGSWHIVREMPNGTFALDEASLHLGMNNCRLHFLPSVDGDGNKGGVKAVLGIALIGAALFVPGLQGVAMPLIGGTLKTFGIMTGLALALGGLSLILSPTPKLSTGGGDDQSALIGGNFNPSGQNYAIPIVGGLFRVRGMPVATEIVTEEFYVADGSVYNNPYNGEGGGGYGDGYYQMQREV